MKQMQDFNKWLFSSRAAGTPKKRRLVALTKLSPERLLRISGELTWFFWEAPEAVNAS